jgi:hypothetical protein
MWYVGVGGQPHASAARRYPMWQSIVMYGVHNVCDSFQGCSLLLDSYHIIIAAWLHFNFLSLYAIFSFRYVFIPLYNVLQRIQSPSPFRSCNFFYILRGRTIWKWQGGIVGTVLLLLRQYFALHRTSTVDFWIIFVYNALPSLASGQLNCSAFDSHSRGTSFEFRHGIRLNSWFFSEFHCVAQGRRFGNFELKCFWVDAVILTFTFPMTFGLMNFGFASSNVLMRTRKLVY